MSDQGRLPTPPKFNIDQIGPTTTEEWQQFYRWLLSMWRRTDVSIDAQAAVSLFPAVPSGTHDEQLIGEALALPRFPVSSAPDPGGPPLPAVYPRPYDADIPGGTTPTPVPPSTDIAWLALLKPPYPQSPIRSMIVDTHGNRANYLAASYAVGQEYWESDRLLRYVVQIVGGVNAWVYESGRASVIQANLAAFVSAAPALGTNDANLLIEISDYFHVLRWTGSAFTFAPNDDGSAYYRLSDSAPNYGLWHAVDGTAGVSYLLGVGTLATKTLPAATPAYIKVGGGDGALHVPVAPAFTGTPGTTSVPSATVNQAALGITAFAGSDVHTHDLTPIGTIDTTGEPENLYTNLWFRQ